MYQGHITDVEGIKVGHACYENGMTGCTVIICEEGATPGIDVRGSAPGTRETDIFKAKKTVNKVHGIVLSGGSAFGLEAASGVMNYLEEVGVGLEVGPTRVPIVASAVIYDLEIGDYRIRPDLSLGYEAASLADQDDRSQGNIGCGLGATVGKLLGSDSSMKGGLGSASIRVGDLVVGAIVAVNAVGDIFDYKDNTQLAGPYRNGHMENSYELIKTSSISRKTIETSENKNTTIGVIATNAKLSKSQASKISEMAHNGYARSINPVHTLLDGDTIFTMGTNKIESDINLIGSLAAEVMSRAIVNGIKSADSYKGFKAYKDIK